MPGTTGDRILARIRGGGRGGVYTNKDFLDLAGRDAVDRALRRLADGGALERIHRGIYYYPRTNPRLGISLSPDPDKVAAAVARRTGSRSEASGAAAANRLGLTTQVPSKLVYLTDGPSKQVTIGKQTLILKHVAPSKLSAEAKPSRLILAAIRHLGRDGIDNTVVERLRALLPDADKRRLLEDVRYQTDWIVEVVKQITKPEK